MDYSNIMKDYVSYIKRHKKEELNAELLGRIHSYRGEYLSYLFSCYYQDFLDTFIYRIQSGEEIRKGQQTRNPMAREVREDEVRMQMMELKGFYLAALPVVKDEKNLYRPVERAVANYRE